MQTDESLHAIVQAFRQDGVLVFSETAPGLPLFGDTYGGVVTLIPSDWGPGYGGGLARIGGNATTPSWRYESTRTLLPGTAQGFDGTIYLIE